MTHWTSDTETRTAERIRRRELHAAARRRLRSARWARIRAEARDLGALALLTAAILAALAVCAITNH